MKEARFKNLSYKERRNRLAAGLKKKSKGILSDKDIDMIVRKLDINVQYNLQLLHSAEEMQKELTLIWYEPDFSKSHVSYVREHGKVLLGTAGFILIKHNWNRSRFPGDFHSRPVLNENEKTVITVERQQISLFKDAYKEIKKISYYTMYNRDKHKIRSFKLVIELMEKMKVIKNINGFYHLNEGITCYNTMFAINRKYLNAFRTKYLCRVYKCEPDRMRTC